MSAGRNAQLVALNELGQSVWYDNLSRDVLRSGELKSFIAAGVSGLTSNPTIFKQAIADSTDYDEELKRLASSGLDTEQICEELMLHDVGEAADLLLPTYKSSNAADGYASIEVSPFLARDTVGTLEAAKKLFAKLNRPNIMIKIPATDEGLPAIKLALEAGINVNITLIFSVAYHEKVMEAYLAALETRVGRAESVDQIASVASFFVSRVDAICEKKFDQLLAAGSVKEADKNLFLGKVGVANSRVAYARFKQLFGCERFAALRAKGARVQRPLWASTGTKNPDFNPVLYVEELVGADTVNTTPPKTLKLLMQGANIEPRLDRNLAEAEQVLSTLKQLGLPFDDLLQELQEQGVKSFSDSYQELLDSIETKRKQLL